MKEMGGIGTVGSYTALAGQCIWGLCTRCEYCARAQHIYELFVAGQGDSIHAALNRELQEKLAPALFQ